MRELLFGVSLGLIIWQYLSMWKKKKQEEKERRADISIDVVADARIRLFPCDACRKYKFIGFWNTIVIHDRDKPVRKYHACCSVCQFAILRADEEAYEGKTAREADLN